MSHRGLLLTSFLALALFGLPAAARTSTLPETVCQDAACTESAGVATPAETVDSQRNSARRPAAAPKKPAAVAPRSTQSRGQHWHRFLPGMFR